MAFCGDDAAGKALAGKDKKKETEESKSPFPKSLTQKRKEFGFEQCRGKFNGKRENRAFQSGAEEGRLVTQAEKQASDSGISNMQGQQQASLVEPSKGNLPRDTLVRTIQASQGMGGNTKRKNRA